MNIDWKMVNTLFNHVHLRELSDGSSELVLDHGKWKETYNRHGDIVARVYNNNPKHFESFVVEYASDGTTRHVRNQH